jgi:hypothetical protein
MAEYFDGIILPNKSKVAFGGITKKIRVVNVRQDERDERAWPKKVVATKRINKGEVIGCYAGEIKKFPKDDKEDLKKWTPFQVIPYLDADEEGNDYYIDASRFENELKYVCDVSCTNEEKPNVEFKESEDKVGNSRNKSRKGGKIEGYYMSEVYAIRSIVPGEEIVASYSEDYWEKVLAWSRSQQPNEEQQYESDQEDEQESDEHEDEEMEVEEENEDESLEPAFVIHDSKPSTKKQYEEQSRRTREAFEKLRQQAEQNKKQKDKSRKEKKKEVEKKEKKKEKKVALKKGKKTERQDDSPVYMCEPCFMIYNDRGEYNRHMAEKHEGEHSDKYNEEWEENDDYILGEGDPEYNLSNEAEPGPIKKRNKTSQIAVK